MQAVETSGLAKTYGRPRRGGRAALRGVELSVPAGSAFGLIGPNGAGKTTFVKAILGIVRPTTGRVRLLGGDPDDPRMRARVGYLPERLQLPPSWTPLEILEAIARMKALRQPRAAIERLLERVGLACEAGRRTGPFSKGMKQRVGLAAALVGRPELLVLDEPTDGLDPLARVEVREILREELARGATVLLNSHLLAETERICGRIAILVEGRIAQEGPLDELCAAKSRWRLRWEDAPADALAASGFVPGAAAGEWFWQGSGAAELNLAVDRARAAGAILLELARESRSLEEVLADAVEAA